MAPSFVGTNPLLLAPHCILALLEMTFLSGMTAFQGLSLLSFQETLSNSHSKALREADALLRRTLFNTWKAKWGQTT